MRFLNLSGAAMLLLLIGIQGSGWTWSDADRLSGVPRSVRDNPGSYRSIYTTYTHYTGGK